MERKPYFIAGIDTNIGKTTVSAILCKATGADYWKPVQSGELDNSDTLKVKRLVGKEHTGRFHPESFALKHPLSPHAAAELEGVILNKADIHIPPTENTLIIEGAGGLMVPLNHWETYLDWVEEHQLPIILVSKNYLGSINHTLLSIQAIKQRHLNLLGVIINGSANTQSEAAIEKIGQTPILFHTEWTQNPDNQYIGEQSEKLSHLIKQLP
ncbi:MAG TPA: dethiobiotin synthase [Luteibaculaceae bacterium]|nr:dethiobiotin synthase [Luteibaculaceae bacterium]